MTKRANSYKQVEQAIATLTPYRHNDGRGDWTDMGVIVDGHYVVSCRIFGQAIKMLDITLSSGRVNLVNRSYYTDKVQRIQQIIRSRYTRQHYLITERSSIKKLLQ